MRNAIVNAICCDILISITSYRRFVYLIEQASKSVYWQRHSFVVVIDNIPTEEEIKIKDWYYTNKSNYHLPEVIIIKASTEDIGNQAALFSAGIKAGVNPYIYFQNEKDELPVNIDKCINFLYKNKDYYATFGQCKALSSEGILLEKFPLLNLEGKYKYNCVEATKLFPSYAHPLSAIYRKSLFEKVPYWDMSKAFKDYSYYYFILRMFQHPEFKVKYMPFTIKLSKRMVNTASIITQRVKESLIHDIKLWLSEFSESAYKDFQLEILRLLENGEISTFKEIDARIEDYLDRVCIVK